MPAGMMQACHIQVMPACCRNSSMACTDTSEPCTSYSSMYSKQAEYLHAGVVVDMQRHHRDNYIILYTASDQKYSEWVHVNCDEVHNKVTWKHCNSSSPR